MWKSTSLGICAAILTCAAVDAQSSRRHSQVQSWVECGSEAAGAVVVETADVQQPSARDAATRQPSSTTRPAGRDTSAVERALRTYADTFNKHDAAALAALWSPTGVYEDRDTGERLEGRDAIQADLADLFKKRPGVRLSIRADRVRFIGPDVAKVNGEVTVNASGEEPRETGFSAIFTRQEGQWLLDTAEETDSPSPVSARAALKELEWMVGTWEDQSEDVRVETTARWSRGGSFLIRSYTVQTNDEEKPREGTQVIGWDPRSRQIRSWTFESDGSFGEGTWSRNGDEWLVRLTYTSVDGGLSTATQVISKINNNQIKTQMVGMEVDGAPLPSMEPVMVARVSTSESPSSDRR